MGRATQTTFNYLNGPLTSYNQVETHSKTTLSE